MSDKLTRKQVLALSRALKRKGRKLPRVGHCVVFARGKRGGHGGEVCHSVEGGKHVYRHSGGSAASKWRPPTHRPFWDTVKREVVFAPRGWR